MTVQLPLSDAQAVLWHGYAKAGQHTAAAFRLPLVAPGGRQQVQQALRTVIASHDALRTRFPVVEHRPVQVVERSTLDLDLPYQDIRRQSYPDTEQLWQATFDAMAAPLDTERTPARWRLFRTGEQEYQLFGSLGHLIIDGMSIDVLRDDLDIALAGGDERPKPCGYAEWSTRRPETAPIVPDVSLLIWQPRWDPDESDMDYRHEVARATVTTQRDVQRLPGCYGVAPFVVILACWALALARAARSSTVPISVPHHCRRHDWEWRIVGPLTNTFYVPFGFVDGDSFGALVKRAAEAFYRGMDLAVPARTVMRGLYGAQSDAGTWWLGRRPMPSLQLRYPDAPASARSQPIMAGPTGPTFNDAELFVNVTSNGIRLSLQHSSRVGRAAAQRLLADVDDLIARAVAGDAATLTDRIAEAASHPPPAVVPSAELAARMNIAESGLHVEQLDGRTSVVADCPCREGEPHLREARLLADLFASHWKEELLPNRVHVTHRGARDEPVPAPRDGDPLDLLDMVTERARMSERLAMAVPMELIHRDPRRGGLELSSQVAAAHNSPHGRTEASA